MGEGYIYIYIYIYSQNKVGITKLSKMWYITQKGLNVKKYA